MMRVRGAIQSLAFICVCLSTCFAHHTAVIVNKSNSVENVASTHLCKIIRSEAKKWPDGRNITLVLHKDWAGETETLEHLNRMTASEWKSFLAAHKDSLVFVAKDAHATKPLEANPG